ncbi:MAG: cell division ATP-binding protein FtsE [Bacillota bacterium]|nr:cell division ATP-binding protein FtsE [Bacillota bacterium]
MIDFKNVTKVYGDCIALNDATLHIDDGEFVFVVGPSGAGKSTFIKLMLKQIKPDEGEIIINTKVFSAMSNREVPFLRREIGMVFQDFRLLPNKTVYENVAFAMQVIHASPRLIKRQVPQILQVMGIADAKDRFPHELSGGEQQRVAIARAIINNPKILIADEPTGNLDKETAKEIMELIDMINHRGTTVVMVTHATDIVERMGKRVIAIDDGRIIADRRLGGQYV